MNPVVLTLVFYSMTFAIIWWGPRVLPFNKLINKLLIFNLIIVAITILTLLINKGNI